MDFIQEQGLQSMLKARTITWEHQTSDLCSTLDTVFASHRLASTVVRCEVHSVDYGSDHKGIVLETSTPLDNYRERETKRLYYDANWEAIRTTLAERTATGYTGSSLETKDQLDQAAEALESVVSTTLEELVPRAKPSPYAKRWWTKELTQLRHRFTTLRNRITKLRRQDKDTAHTQLLAHQARKTYFDEISHQKALHWKEFLDNPGNIWKANQFTKGSSTPVQVPTLSKDGRTAQQDRDKADMLMETFFPIPPMPVAPVQLGTSRQPRSVKVPHQITMHEATKAVFASNPKKAAGIDSLTFKVWQEL